MPLGSKDSEILSDFQKRYGRKQGKRAYYASINAGKVTNTPEARRMALKRKHHKRQKRARRMT